MTPSPALALAPLRALCTLGVALVLCTGAACGSGGEAQPAPKVAASADDPPEPKTDDTATIDAYCNPPSKILVDGKPAGMSPVTGFKVKPGSHDVTFVDEMTGNRTMTVVLEPGDGKVVTSDRPPSATQKPKPEKGDKGKGGKDDK
jgi:hypothetical protein